MPLKAPTATISQDVRERRAVAAGRVITCARKIISALKKRNQKGLPAALSELEHVLQDYDAAFEREQR